MKLIKVNYDEFKTSANSNPWVLKDLHLGKFNLIVGRNATGKTRSMNAIHSLSLLIKDEKKFSDGSWSIDFLLKNKKNFHYELCIENDHIVKEKIIIEGIPKLTRNKIGATTIFSETLNKDIKINPPKNEITLKVRRDEKEYPFFEELFTWASNLRMFGFSKTNPNSIYVPRNVNDFKIESLDIVPSVLEKLEKEDIRTIISNFNSIGYNISKATTKQIPNAVKGFKMISLKEEELKFSIDQIYMSQGMFRAFSLLVIIHHLMKTQEKGSTIIVDDLCEGLDYERTTKLGKLLFEKYKDTDTQFLFSSNDTYLMDVIPIRHWNVLRRDKNIVKSINYINSKEKFEDFEFSSLSNYELFTSNF